MADINVERKRPSIWLWAVGAIVLAVLIWSAAKVLEMRGSEASAPVEETR